MHGRTTFIIAHRLSTLDNCDVRLHVENGQLIANPPLKEPLLTGAT
jgi:ABC-type multidrug transport system fused ATPase/permease subunit